MATKFIRACVACTTLVVFAGCGGNDLGTVPVTGTVKVDGSPMEGVTVVFSPSSGSSGRAASAQTDASGVYKLTTEVAGDGALPGDYTVSVSKNEAQKDESLPDEVDPNDPNSLDAIYGQLDTKKQAKAKNAIAEKWGSGGTSGLTATVTEDGENNFDFDVTSK